MKNIMTCKCGNKTFNKNYNYYTCRKCKTNIIIEAKEKRLSRFESLSWI